MLKKTVILLFLILNISCYGQEDRLYLHLITSYKYREFGVGDIRPGYLEGDSPEILWRVEDHKIQMLDTLSVATHLNMRLQEITDLAAQKWLFFREDLKKGGNWDDRYVQSILDYKGDSLVLRRLFSSYSEFRGHSLRVAEIIGENNDIVWSGYNCIDDKTDNLGFNRYFKKLEVSEDDFQYMTLYGTSLFIYPFFPYGSYIFDKNGILRIFYGMRCGRKRKREEYLKTNLQVPEDMRTDSAALLININVPESDYIVTTLETNYTEYISEAKKKEHEEKFKNAVWVKHKQTGAFEMLDVPVNWRHMAGYKNWLYGTVHDTKWLENYQYYGDDKKGHSRQWEFFKMQGIDTSRYNCKSWEIPPLFMGATGELFLYYIPTRKKIHWATGDLDSEFIKLEDGWIYYRVFDELRRVPLDEDRLEVVWEKEELLAKDKNIIPYVHHIFWHKKSKVYEEWTTRKPGFVREEKDKK